MKWKCNVCLCGPCVYESASDDNYLMVTDKCPRGSCITRWQKMSGEEPEQKGKIGLPEWLMVGNFVVFNGCNTVCRIEGYDIDKKIVAISEKSWRASRAVKRDLHCDPKGENARVVFPQPYTFETAPVALKVRRKDDGQIEVARLEIQQSSVDAAYRFSLFSYRPVRFDELLENWERLDGWPCGTFDGEGGNEK